ncbi:uncharacterized protein LY89DRAFT_679465 [Mollisia scopiformis]|uniref:Transcriptional regulator n=1 Tax=Mollisia scopiformis TaxID=149040 RepID=A0A194XVQ4_MOLSC|nr:uncharacterized protein LY89DRAFT_679465 [Mollisia scopiformis]KUJ24303.1 hypothetical protein LY89DRAFT_679465 [Mollisia scopiformis]
MYFRPVHTDLHLPTLYKFIQTNPLGILTTAIPSSKYNTIQSSHIPWILDLPPPSDPDPDPDSPPPNARLRGHMALANPHVKALIEAATASGSNTLTEDVMILFNGPAHHYITPKFYVETKPATGKVVPTWNYTAVQVYGTATVHFDTSMPETGTFISMAIADLSRQSEEGIFGFDGKEGRPGPWSVGEAPEAYVALLSRAIVGVEVEVKSVAGKFKMNQELGVGDRVGVIEGFEKLGTDLGREMARTVRERGELKDRLALESKA